jgi:hypothetical protein
MKPTTQILLAAAVIGVFWLGTATQVAQAHPDYGCSSCHVPHNAASDTAVPLWNPEHTTTTLTGNYSSPTMDATTGEVDGASKLCLSCHDGSLSKINGTEAQIHSLETAHPISFVYDTALATADGELVDPTTLASDILDANAKMQCTSCHDVHATAAAAPNLRWPYANAFGAGGTVLNNAAFCRNCHLK